MLIIWRAMVTYLDNNLRKGQSVNIRKFGSFTFDISTDLPRIATRQISPTSDLGIDRRVRKNVHRCRYVSVSFPFRISNAHKPLFVCLCDLDHALLLTPFSASTWSDTIIKRRSHQLEVRTLSIREVSVASMQIQSQLPRLAKWELRSSGIPLTPSGRH